MIQIARTCNPCFNKNYLRVSLKIDECQEWKAE